jgi:hypothetical protein
MRESPLFDLRGWTLIAAATDGAAIIQQLVREPNF